MNIAVTGNVIWGKFCDVMGRPDWKDDARYATAAARSENRHALNAEIEAITLTRSTAEWIDAFNAAGVPAGEINDISQVFANPQVRHLGLAQPVTSQERGETELVGQPIIMSRTPSHIAAPAAGGPAHRRDPGEIGYSEAEIAEMKASGAI
jgi:crotonobetainyl-CoA:carnitine CoA-transferase CaiB-like acyl-CoA transferase